MLAAERTALILHILNKDRFAAVDTIAGLASSSEATIRRDLGRLEKEGLVRRVRGGAERALGGQPNTAAHQPGTAAHQPGTAAGEPGTAAGEPGTAAGEPGTAAREPGTAAGQIPFDERLGILWERKRRIAAAAAALCTDDDTVMIDGGSTTFPMAEFLLPLKLRVITNSFAIAEKLVGGSRPEYGRWPAGYGGPPAGYGGPPAGYGGWAGTVILTGGVVYPESRLVLDPFAEEPFGNYRASKAFMGVYGIDETGATNTEALLIKAERSMISRAREVVILADSSKFGRRGSLFLCGFDRIAAVITDEGIAESARQTLAERGVRLIVA
jgi:DeoR/GlpR family transcriptional regulator of sugar metabolism